MNSWWGAWCLPCGGTEAVVLRIWKQSARWTPSPETSRVIDGFSDLRATFADLPMMMPVWPSYVVEVRSLDQLGADVLTSSPTSPAR